MTAIALTRPQGSALKGVLLVISAVLAFALSDVATKYLVERHNVPLIVALRYAVNLLLLVIVLAPRHGRALLQTQRTGLVLLRGATP